jgi:hypothetical protein|tara:strand:- start:418 stop:1062 length:645 start_codon:yes stop_codon:yes gene_type:complete
MKSTEMLNQIKTLLNIEVKLEEMKLENGTIVESDSFEKGKEIFIKTDEDRVALPVGEYILEDSRLLVIEEEGIIGDVKEVSDEVPEKEEITEDLEDKEDEYEDDGKEADVEDWAGMEKRIKNLEDAIADLKGDKMEEVVEEDLKEETEGVLKSRTVKEEFNEVEEKVKEELSKPSTNPIKHSPESGNKNKVKGFLHSQNRVETVLDRVLSRLNK